MLRRFFRRATKVPVDALIDAVLEQMHGVGVLADEYPKLLAYLERLNKLKAEDKPDPVSRDTIALIAGNLMGVLLIVAYEQKHVITSKGFNQLIRPKSTN